MKLEFDFNDLNLQWKERQLDLFPWFDGLFALLRTKEGNLMETEKRLLAASTATKIQFLSSDDKNSAQIARKTIKKESPESLLPILLYSMEKVDKQDYIHRIMESLLDFNPTLSIGYLLGYLNLRKMQKEKVFQIITLIFANLKGIFPTIEDEEKFLGQIFQAMETDLKDRMPSSKKINNMEDFEKISLDLEIIHLIFNKTSNLSNAPTVEMYMQTIGKNVIKSLKDIPFEFRKGKLQIDQFIQIMIYMALMRLKADLSFLKNMPKRIANSDLSENDKEEILKTSEVAINVIENPKKTIQEILKDIEQPYIFSY